MTKRFMNQNYLNVMIGRIYSFFNMYYFFLYTYSNSNQNYAKFYLYIYVFERHLICSPSLHLFYLKNIYIYILYKYLKGLLLSNLLNCNQYNLSVKAKLNLLQSSVSHDLFRNHSNMMIWYLRNISYYHECLVGKKEINTIIQQGCI